ncbi:DUF5336 domain-containing protein [Gordonia spumicola]|nr:DUF5336 domain-containing protein [Gordonia spumicola]
MTQPPYQGQPGPPPSDPNHPAPGFEQTAAFDPAQAQPQWNAQQAPGSQPFPGQPGPYPPPGPYGQPGFGPPPPARPSFLAQLPLPYKLTLGSSLAGIITFFMGFVAWLSIDEAIGNDAEDWANDLNGTVDVPAFFSPTLLLSVGWFFILLGAVGIATVALIAPKWRKFLPYLAFLAVAGWLGIFAASVTLPSFVTLGAGAYVSMIFGFIQAALLVAAVLIEGLNEAKHDQQP